MKRSRLLLALVLLAACGDPIGNAWLVERPRALAARVSPASDPSRANVGPNEPAHVSWLVVGAPRFAHAFAVCKRPDGNYPDPRCATTLATGAGEGTEIDFTVPQSDLLVLAAFCDAGTATLDAAAFTATCSSGSEPVLATVNVTPEPNQNPILRDDQIAIDPACLPGDREIGFRFDAGEAGEALLLSHVVTAGELDRQFSVLEATEAAPKQVTIPWSPPATGGDVEMYFVLRDGRGGTAFTKRTICVRR